MIYTLFHLHGRFLFLKNKFWEIQAYREEHWTEYFNLHFSLTRKCDHAGLRFELNILSFGFEFMVYDKRHWDYDNDRWIQGSYGRTYTELDL